MLVPALVTAGCAGPDPRAAPEGVAVALKWTHDAESAGLYMARAAGLYAAEGLRVELLEGGPGYSPVHRVAHGEAHFAVSGAAAVTRARAAGHDVVAIAALYQQSPVGFFAFPEVGLARPADLLGKRVAYGPDEEPFLRGILRHQGLDPAGVRQVERTADLAPWFAGAADVWSGHVTNQAAAAQATGRAVDVLYPDDWGVHLYDDVVVTRGSLARERPDLVVRFLRATLEGWTLAVQQPVRAVEATLAADPDLDPAAQRRLLRASAPLLLTGLEPLGWMQPERWDDIHTLLVAEGLVPRGDTRAAQAYDLRFLREVYAHGP